jgi:hypothetical protein
MAAHRAPSRHRRPVHATLVAPLRALRLTLQAVRLCLALVALVAMLLASGALLLAGSTSGTSRMARRLRSSCTAGIRKRATPVPAPVEPTPAPRRVTTTPATARRRAARQAAQEGPGMRALRGLQSAA